MKFLKGFLFAARGIAQAFKERNFRFHLCVMAFAVYFAARFYMFSAEHWAILLLTCSAVLAAETVNTAIERLCDRVTDQPDPLIRTAKDCAAGAVLITAVNAVAVGVCLFWNTDIFSLILIHFTEPLRLILLIIAIACAWGFVFAPELIRAKSRK